jgi:hypothetical protein
MITINYFSVKKLYLIAVFSVSFPAFVEVDLLFNYLHILWVLGERNFIMGTCLWISVGTSSDVYRKTN